MKRFFSLRAKVLLPLLLLVVLLLLPATAQASGHVHIVRPGENLYRIALRYGTTINAIAHANGIHNTRLIYVGQRLVIPGGGGGGGHWGGWCRCMYVVHRGDTLSSIAWRHGTNVWTLVRMNGLANPNYIWAGQRLCVPCGGYYPHPYPYPKPHCGMVHVVHRGDTMYSIARRYGSTVWAIAHANGISNPRLIFVGQRLTIPCH
jgi:putative chitinase